MPKDNPRYSFEDKEKTVWKDCNVEKDEYIKLPETGGTCGTETRERVQRGALLLDKENPGWYYEIDLDMLNMQHSHTCVLGQVYGAYHNGLCELRTVGVAPWYYGFYCSSLEETEVRAAWSQEVSARLKPKKENTGMTTAQEVASGAAFLDEEMPDWFTKINLDTFDIDDAYNCILGQLYGFYFNARAKLKVEGHALERKGFETGPDDSYRAVEDMWIVEIEKRKKAVGKPVLQYQTDSGLWHDSDSTELHLPVSTRMTAVRIKPEAPEFTPGYYREAPFTDNLDFIHRPHKPSSWNEDWESYQSLSDYARNNL